MQQSLVRLERNVNQAEEEEIRCALELTLTAHLGFVHQLKKKKRAWQ